MFGWEAFSAAPAVFLVSISWKPRKINFEAKAHSHDCVGWCLL